MSSVLLICNNISFVEARIYSTSDTSSYIINWEGRRRKLASRGDLANGWKHTVIHCRIGAEVVVLKLRLMWFKKESCLGVFVLQIEIPRLSSILHSTTTKSKKKTLLQHILAMDDGTFRPIAKSADSRLLALHTVYDLSYQ